jgi:4-hydroxy-tetrahydrodipicolinate synthase
MLNRSLAGVVPAVVTPFRPDERIDFDAWQKIIDHQIAAGVDGIFACGGQGEFFALEEEERVVALRFCRQHVGKRVPLYGNVGCITTRDTVRLAQQAESDGVDVLVVITPFYLKPTEDELVEHFVEVCRSVRAPVVAYNIPERTGVELTPAAVARICARAENFAGLKDSGGKLDQVPAYVAAGDGKPFSVFMGRDHMILQGLELGCAGAVTACANVAPRLFVDLYRAFREGNREEAERLQALADPLRQSFGLHTFPSVVKTAMEMVGLPAGPCRRPVGPMPQAAREKLAPVLATLAQAGYLTVSPQRARS